MSMWFGVQRVKASFGGENFAKFRMNNGRESSKLS